MAYKLPPFCARSPETHSIDHIIKTRFEQLQQQFAGVAAPALCVRKVTAELTFKQAIEPFNLLLLTKLTAVVGRTASRCAAMRARFTIEPAICPPADGARFSEKDPCPRGGIAWLWGRDSVPLPLSSFKYAGVLAAGIRYAVPASHQK